MDFMRKLGFVYEEDDAGTPHGQWHKLYTAKYAPQVGSLVAAPEPEVAVAVEEAPATRNEPILPPPSKKPWWKFWAKD